ncbi:MAG TPA: amidohydrolase family protein [Acidobacteriota bacterium]|nr:amidohydrolase family protein [Acidobacteriota bacterium]
MSKKHDEAANLERCSEPPGERHLATVRLPMPLTPRKRARGAIVSGSLLLALVGTIALTVSCDTGGDGSGGSGADWVLTGGDIVTMDDGNPSATAVAIEDGELTYVGDDAGAAAFVSEATRTVDLAGRLVIPGLIDGHTHPGYINLEDRESVSGSSREEFLEAVREHAESNPGDEGWIRLCCWPNGLFVDGSRGPHRRDLDRIVADRPMWIASGSWHSNWLNSKALEVLGIDASTPDPRPGLAMYARDADGSPTGWVKEGAGWQHLASLFDPDDEHEASVVAFLQTLSENGVTTVYDGGNFGYEDHVYALLARLDRAGELPLRYEGTYQVFVPERRFTAVEEMRRLQQEYGGERLRFRTVKLFMDGILSNHSGALLEPYAHDPSFTSDTLLSTAELRDFLLELHEAQLDLHVHTIGDRAVRIALDAVEAARAAVEGELYPRVTLSHVQVIDPVDMPRLATLDVSANLTAWWFGVGAAYPEETELAALGPGRDTRIYMAQSLVDAGGRVTFSSDDWGLSAISPYLNMHGAHTREVPGVESAGPRPPATERMDLRTIVRGFTLDGAYPFRMEDRIGSLEVGKLADLVVLDEDLFMLDPADIPEVQPSAVMMEGVLVHGELPGASPPAIAQ